MTNKHLDKAAQALNVALVEQSLAGNVSLSVHTPDYELEQALVAALSEQGFISAPPPLTAEEWLVERWQDCESATGGYCSMHEATFPDNRRPAYCDEITETAYLLRAYADYTKEGEEHGL